MTQVEPEQSTVALDRQDERLTQYAGARGALRSFLSQVRSGDLGALPVVVGLILIAVIFQILNSLFLSADNPEDVKDEAIERLQALVAAGANSVYPVKIQDDDALLTAVVEAIDAPVNSTAHPVKHDLERFRRLGVGRITYGPLLQLALTDAMKDMISPWK